MIRRFVKRVFKSVVVVIVLAACAFFAWSWHGELPPQKTSTASFDPAIVAKGAQLAAIGNCIGCHTEADGAPYAGGYPAETPFGIIYGTNITPDPETGIGSWSEDAFRRAMRDGVDRKGNHLYPAFPYDHFTHVTDSDISALYAFLMTREPVAQQNRAPALPFPVNNRLAAAAWNLIFLNKGGLQYSSSQIAEWNRGAYLAEGLGHCGGCHTPRNTFGAEKQNEQYAGGEGEGWQAPALNAASPAPAPWTVDQIYAYLRNGFAEDHGAVAGAMASVVNNLKPAPDSDLRALAYYVASLAGRKGNIELDQKMKSARDFAQSRAINMSIPASPATTGSNAGNESDANESTSPNGSEIFAGACASCHHGGGELPISRPVELGLSTPVNSPDPTNLIRIVLDGVHPASGERGMWMPGFSGALNDAQIVALVSYMRSQFSRQPPWPNVAEILSKVRPTRNVLTVMP